MKSQLSGGFHAVFNILTAAELLEYGGLHHSLNGQMKFHGKHCTVFAQPRKKWVTYYAEQKLRTAKITAALTPKGYFRVIECYQVKCAKRRN